jgi:four helix bundle protein
MRPHKKLNAWIESIALIKAVYKVTNSFPDSEKYGIVSQLRRAAVSVPVNIAEGAARNSSKEYCYFLNVALGSLSELDTLIIVSRELEYIDISIYQELEQKIEQSTALISGLYKSINKS